MDFLNDTYIKTLVEKSKQGLNRSFNFSCYNFSKFDFVNSFLVDRALSADRTSLLITTNKDRINDLFLPITLIALLHCIKANTKLDNTLQLNEIILNKKDGRVSTVRAVKENQTFILPLRNNKKDFA